MKMKIIFDSALDGRSWPLSNKAMLGEIRVGQLGLLSILETFLGLRGPETSDAIRAAFLVPALQESKNAFWAKSVEVDPLGVARKLLGLCDFLWLHGWRDQPISPRLIDLASLSPHVLPGMPDRLVAVTKGHSKYKGSALPDIITLEQLETLPLTWQDLFKKLTELGVITIEQTLPITESKGDLAQARQPQFTPSGDASLQLIRQDGILQAAEDIAAWLAAVAKDEGLDGTVIIGGDAVLDNALHRFGLPTTGAITDRYLNSLLQLLPLILALGWNPPNPERVMELLSLPSSPVPPSIGRKLIKALGEWPALGSKEWREALAEGLAGIEDHDRREQVKQRMDILFTPAVVSDYPVTEIQRRVGMLLSWLRGRFQDDKILRAPLNQCQTFMTMVEGLGRSDISEPLLMKLLDETTTSTAIASPFQAQAGLAAVPCPEAIVGPAKRIIWWDFSQDKVSSLSQPLFSSQEHQKLTEVGVLLPDSAVLANTRAARWQRPLLQAEEQLILVCPQKDETGTERHPHPLWDELMAASNDRANNLVSTLVRGSANIVTALPELVHLPIPQARWQVEPGTISPRECESPSSLEVFLGCPLSWSLRYTGKIKSGHSATLPDLVPTLGSLAHELVEEVLLQPTLPSPTNGASLVRQLFDTKAPLMVAALFQEGMEGKREDVRNMVILATRSLLQHLCDAGVGNLAIEKHLTATFGKQKLQGWADIVLSRPFTVIDLKRSWAKFFKEKMTSGTALQLVLYGWLLKELKGSYPELAYYTLEDQTFITTDPKHFFNGDHVETPNIDEVWKAFFSTFQDVWAVLDTGLVPCPGNDEDVKSGFEAGRLILEPPCRFCDYDILCGRRFSE